MNIIKTICLSIFLHCIAHSTLCAQSVATSVNGNLKDECKFVRKLIETTIQSTSKDTGLRSLEYIKVTLIGSGVADFYLKFCD